MTEGYIRGKPDPQWWLATIRKSTTYRDKYTYKARWGDWRNYYRGQWNQGVMPDNLFFKMMRTMIPRVYFRNPQVSITPRKGKEGQSDYVVLAALVERLDNTLIDQMKFKQTMKSCVQDAFMFGTGIFKHGYGGEFNPTPELAQDTGAPLENGRYHVEYDTRVKPNMPWALRVPTGNFLVPVGATDWPSSRFAIHRVRRHIEDVREDTRFRNVKDLNPGTIQLPGGRDLDLKDQIDLFEVRDKKTEHVFVIAPQATEKVLFDEKDEMQFERRLPFFIIQFNPDDEVFWAVPDAHILDPQQLEANEISSQIRAHRRISVLKWLAKKGAINPDEIAKLNSSNVNEVLNIDPEHSLADVKDITAGDLPAGILKAQTINDQRTQEILGLGVNQFGEYAPGSADRSATEAAVVNQATQIRTDERRDIVADNLVDFIEQLNHTILHQWEGNEKVVDILGPDGQQLWVSFNLKDVNAVDYDVKVDPDSSVPETRALRQQKAAQVYKGFGQDPLISKPRLLKWTLNEVGGPELMDLQLTAQEMQAAAAQAGGAVQPGQPGSSPAQPMPAAQLIQELARRRAGGRG